MARRIHYGKVSDGFDPLLDLQCRMHAPPSWLYTHLLDLVTCERCKRTMPPRERWHLWQTSPDWRTP